MTRVLLISVRFHDGRYHGEPEWPPSPGRLFQALLSGCAVTEAPSVAALAALRWLETLGPPELAAPTARVGAYVGNFVPNNDLDAVGGDPSRIGELRTAKAVKPRLFDATLALHYAWRWESSEVLDTQAAEICRVANTLYQLGRGVDMAWAFGEVLDDAELSQRLAAYPGVVYRPADSGPGEQLACPQPGSLDSLLARHAAQRHRFAPGARKGQLTFAQPPRPRFRQVAYNSPVMDLVYDLAGEPWPLARCAALVQLSRDAAARRLGTVLPAQRAAIDRVLIGRGTTEADKLARIQIVPLPSIGHAHADMHIRRVLVRVPPNCPVQRDSVAWAFAGLPLQTDPDTGEIALTLVAADNRSMLKHYGAVGATSARHWRSVTPVALPRSGSTRSTAAEIHALRQALRHAGLPADAEIRCIQREPLDVHGQRAESFATSTRFEAHRLWHVELAFATPISGPVVLGDGRYLGLGLMRAVPGAATETGVLALRIESGLTPAATAETAAGALRRATMARVQQALGPRAALPTFFTGHNTDGAASNDPGHGHLAFAMDTAQSRLLVIAPHRLQGRTATRHDRVQLAVLYAALQGLRDVYAGIAGHLRLAPVVVDSQTDPLLCASSVWESVTDYSPTRHAKRLSAADALVADVRAEITRLSWVLPTHVQVLEVRTGPRGGIAGRLRLHFQVAVHGPVLLGRTRHGGGGLFQAVESPKATPPP